MSTPLTYAELNLGDYWISFPEDGDDSGHGGYRRGSYVFRKDTDRASTRLIDGAISNFTKHSSSMKVLKVYVPTPPESFEGSEDNDPDVPNDPQPKKNFDKVLVQLAKNLDRLNKAIINTNATYRGYDKAVKDYKDCMERSQALYLETLKTIERIHIQNI